MKIAIVNGPNLNLLGKRNPEVYGNLTMEHIMADIQSQSPGTFLDYFQSNHEGALIDHLQYLAESKNTNGIVINAGGYAHTSIALRDAIDYVIEQGIPVVNVHISDIRTRESFRNLDLLTEVCTHTIIGHGTNGYKEAVDYLIHTVH